MMKTERFCDYEIMVAVRRGVIPDITKHISKIILMKTIVHFLGDGNYDN